MRRYAALSREAGHPPSHTKLALWTYVAETEREAQAGAERYMVEYADSALRHYELLGNHLGSIKGYESYGAQQEAMRKDPSLFKRGFYNSHPRGTPEQTIKRATELANAFGTDEIMFVFKYGAMPMRLAEKSMRLFAREVMPALKELNPLPLAPSEPRPAGLGNPTPQQCGFLGRSRVLQATFVRAPAPSSPTAGGRMLLPPARQV